MATFPGPLIGMVHLAALPGSPRSSLRVERIARLAAAEAIVLQDAGFDAVLVENMHDLPYLRREVGSEVIAAMSACVLCVRAAVAIPVGVQILAGANRAAMAVANACGGLIALAITYGIFLLFEKASTPNRKQIAFEEQNLLESVDVLHCNIGHLK